MSRSLLLFCAVLALSGCSYSVQGDAAPGAAPSSAEAPDAPKIPAPRAIAGTDPCSFLTQEDLKPLGPFRSPPQRLEAPIPESCQYLLENGTQSGITVVTAVYQRYEDVRDRQKRGREVFIEKYSTWLTCTQQNDGMVCTAVVAVHPERSLLVALPLPGATEDKVVKALEPLAKAALGRLPT